MIGFVLTLIILMTVGLVGTVETIPYSPVQAAEDHYIYLPAIFRPQTNLIENPGFEDASAYGGCLWRDIAGQEHFECPQEVRPPRYHVQWWNDGVKKDFCTVPVVQPEGAVIDKVVDPFRIYAGEHSYQYFNFFNCQQAGLMVHRLLIYEGSGYYQAGIKAHSWYGGCNDPSKVHDPHVWYQETPADPCEIVDWAHLTMRMGIDPRGGDNPESPYVEWGPWIESYNVWADVESPVVGMAAPSSFTIFFESRTTHPLRNANVIVDEMWLKKVAP